MYLAPDDAKTDVILAAATTIFGVNLRGFLLGLPLYPTGRVVGGILDLGWIVVLTALVPVLLARHRGDGTAAFGVAAGGWGRGLTLALPAVFLGLTVPWVSSSGVAEQAVFGRFAGVSSAGSAGDLVLIVAQISAFTVGSLLLVAFLAVRSRDGFPRSPDIALKQIVRTVGMGIVVTAVVSGALQSIRPGGGWLNALMIAGLHVVALLALVLLVDRRTPFGISIPRAAIATPLVVILIAHVFAAGGLFRGDLIGGIYLAALAAGVTLAVSTLAQTRQGVAPALWLVLAVHVWPTCLSPLSFAGGVC